MEVQPPEDNGGIPVQGYRVEYEEKAEDFDSGKVCIWKISNGNSQFFLNYVLLINHTLVKI